jgi:hypothetical protein
LQAVTHPPEQKDIIMKKALFVILAAALLTGCTAGRHTRVFSNALGDDGKAPPLMRNVNVVGWVAFDERYLSNQWGIPNTVLYATGVRKGDLNTTYRYVPVSSPRMDEKGLLWKKVGSVAYVVAAMVPDHIGVLKRGDIVEWRSISSWDSLVDFHETGEGQIVTKVLCLKASPDWQKCHDALPMFHHHKAAGFTGTPFPASVKEYGFTFSQYYDMNGTLLKPLPKN